MKRSDTAFFRFFLGSWGSFVGGAILLYGVGLYARAPYLALISHVVMIVLLLGALGESSRRAHYLLVGGSLIFFGAVTSFDLISSKDELISIWQNWLQVDISDEDAHGFAQSILMINKIFTGCLAAATLFYGLNRRNFTSVD